MSASTTMLRIEVPERLAPLIHRIVKVLESAKEEEMSGEFLAKCDLHQGGITRKSIGLVRVER